MNAYWVFILKKFAEAIFLSPVAPFLLIAYSLLIMRRRPRRGLTFAWFGLLILIFMSTPITVDWMAKPLEIFPPVTAAKLKDARAIVILGGGERPYAREYGGAVPNRTTMERLRYGVRLAKKTNLPVLVSGGALKGGVAEAKLMARTLNEDFGIHPKWVEDRSLDTADNAFFSAEMLRSAGIRRIVLVTSAIHMRRAVAAFRHEGLDVIPAPTGFITDKPPKPMVYDSFPNAAAAKNGWAVVHEWVGLLVQQVRQKITTKRAL